MMEGVKESEVIDTMEQSWVCKNCGRVVLPSAELCDCPHYERLEVK